VSFEAPQSPIKDQPFIRTFALIVIGFLAYHVLLTPVFMLVREAGFPLLRAPIFEEAFKVFVAAKFLTSPSSFRRALLVGSAAGTTETIVNVLTTYDDMIAVLTDSFEDLSPWMMYTMIAVGVSAKLVLATMGHFLFVYAAALIARGWNFLTFLIAAVIHYTVNALILA